MLLRRPANPPAFDDATAELVFSQHLGHLANMSEAGHMKAAGPLGDQPDASLRGMSLYQVGSVEEARRLAELDPAVVAGMFTIEVMTWRTPKGELAQ